MLLMKVVFHVFSNCLLVKRYDIHIKFWEDNDFLSRIFVAILLPQGAKNNPRCFGFQKKTSSSNRGRFLALVFLFPESALVPFCTKTSSRVGPKLPKKKRERSRQELFGGMDFF